MNETLTSGPSSTNCIEVCGLRLWVLKVVTAKRRQLINGKLKYNRFSGYCCQRVGHATFWFTCLGVGRPISRHPDLAAFGFPRRPRNERVCRSAMTSRPWLPSALIG